MTERDAAARAAERIVEYHREFGTPDPDDSAAIIREEYAKDYSVAMGRFADRVEDLEKAVAGALPAWTAETPVLCGFYWVQQPNFGVCVWECFDSDLRFGIEFPKGTLFAGPLEPPA